MLSWLYEETQVDILVHNWLFFAKEIPYGLVFCSSKSFFSSALQGKTALLKYGTGQELNKQQLYFLVYAAGYLQNPNNMWLSCNNITYAGKGKKKKKRYPCSSSLHLSSYWLLLLTQLPYTWLCRCALRMWVIQDYNLKPLQILLCQEWVIWENRASATIYSGSL